MVKTGMQADATISKMKRQICDLVGDLLVGDVE
jgi:hypothetical protein